MKQTLLLFLVGLLFTACSKTANPINYGEDACDFCSMTIVSNTHAAQLVTEKGKNYKFDASECMIHFLESKIQEDQMLYILSANFLEPGELLDAKSASFLISENIPSPMGAFLSATSDEAEAKKLQEKHGGEVYTWEQIKKIIAKHSH